MGPANVPLQDFYRSSTNEPHVIRRKAIMKAHPEIEELCKPDSRPVPFVVAMVIAQLILAVNAKYMSWPVFLFVAWFISGTMSHSLSLMVHELSHGLLFKSKEHNEYFAIFCNIGMGLPTSATFKRYHMEHHQYQGVPTKDADIPVAAEGRFFRSKLLKFIYLIFMPLTYGFRPALIMPKPMNRMEMLNHAVVWTTNFILYKYAGLPAVVFLIGSMLLGHGIHPMSGHFIGEHYVYTKGQETYSYYGALNLLAWNVGYHNEHHDLPRVPGWKLPEVKKIAPEFYDHLAQYSSWTYVLYKFVMDDNISPFNRMVRDQKYCDDNSKSK